MRGRAFESARTYFGCASEEFKLPLMGLPEKGRGSHWETRIMRDDIMSYGGAGVVSTLTLAALEDLGHYLANYSNAGCMAWGNQQGCDFVSTRCGRGSHDSSSVTARQSDCRGDPAWTAHPMAPSTGGILEAKCQFGTDPCSRLTGGAGFIEGAPLVVDGGKRCDAQCYRGADWHAQRPDCSQAPAGEVEGSSILASLLNDPFTRWWLWVIPAVMLLIGILWIFILKSLLCPKTERARTYALGISVVILLVGATATFFSSWMYVNFEAFQAFVGMPTVYGVTIVSVGTLVISLFVFASVKLKQAVLMCASFWLLIALTIVGFCGALLLIYWVYAYDGMATDSLSVLAGTGHADTATRFLDTALGGPLSVVEGAICKTYQMCCHDPMLTDPAAAANGTALEAGSGERTCLQPHEGSLSDIEVALRDPSHSHFCAYVTGSPLKYLVAPPAATCAALVHMSSAFDMAQCQADFCSSGLDGHVAFAAKMVALFRRYILPAGGCCAFIVLLLLVYACNVRHARSLVLEANKVAPAGARPAGSSKQLQRRSPSVRW